MVCEYQRYNMLCDPMLAKLLSWFVIYPSLLAVVALYAILAAILHEGLQYRRDKAEAQD